MFEKDLRNVSTDKAEYGSGNIILRAPCHQRVLKKDMSVRVNQ